MAAIAHNIPIKSPDELKIMVEGGRKLAYIKAELKKTMSKGTRASDIENLATELIKKAKGKPSFKMVNNYYWSTCVNINEGLVHGIPKNSVMFNNGDVISVDVGIFYKGFHTDTSFTVGIEPDVKTTRFLDTGKLALKKSVEKATVGNRIYDISNIIESTIRKSGYSPIKALVGHGVGKLLHEEPQIPCFIQGNREDSPEIKEGMVLAIEVMYSIGKDEVFLDKDGWTIVTRDGKISALFEETIAVRKSGPIVLTVLN